MRVPTFISSGTYVAATAYLGGEVFLSEGYIVGPSFKVKATFMIPDSKITQLSFGGDSIVSRETNIKAGANAIAALGTILKREACVVRGHYIDQTP